MTIRRNGNIHGIAGTGRGFLPRPSACVFLLNAVFLFSFLLAGVPIGRCAAEDGRSEHVDMNGVIELTSRNFDGSMGTIGSIPVVQLDNGKENLSLNKQKVIWLINFYAPWCGHCKRFEPEYLNMALTLHEERNNNSQSKVLVRVGRVDGSSDRALASRFGVRGFPAIFMVDGGKVFEYKGRRSADQLQSWAVESHIRKGEPMSSLDSPLGPIGKLKGYMVRTGFFHF
uniref:Thioredoxin domain-containing protein n=1 Tax=Corethron hystrix TaxID=216773 RepID=A0A7S1BPV4_9STRA|mmetsp:Transcript_34998/g.80931  ORF Transcript_34998/g.80931 Transcript_34998/m.80931 type:complete len:228 (+) Transcript_34998:138-821(+)